MLHPDTIPAMLGLCFGMALAYLGDLARARRGRIDPECGMPPAIPPTFERPRFAPLPCGEIDDDSDLTWTDCVPYHPTDSDLLDYSAWSADFTATLAPPIEPNYHAGPCPADYGDYCPECDRERAELEAIEHDRDLESWSDGWYRDLARSSGHDSDSIGGGN